MGDIMNYMLDKINLLENKDSIINSAEKIVEMLKNDKNLNDSEKLMAIVVIKIDRTYLFFLL